jgi:hypothetical protein
VSEGLKVLQSRLAPAVSMVLLVAMLVYGGIDAVRHPGAEAYFAKVAERIDALPYRVGGWVGSDVPPMPAAFEILKPNRIVQREYLHADSKQRISLLITHCADARDMLGHYPPVCYPAHGWERESVEQVHLNTEGVTCPARVYRFHRADGAVERRLMVVNLFVLPDSERPIADDMDAVTRNSRTAAAGGLGVAQFQITSESAESVAAFCEVASRFVETASPVIHAVSEGVPK